MFSVMWASSSRHHTLGVKGGAQDPGHNALTQGHWAVPPKNTTSLIGQVIVP